MDLFFTLIEKTKGKINFIEKNDYKNIDINELESYVVPVSIHIKNNINQIELLDKLYNLSFDYSKEGKSNVIIGNMKLKDFIEKKDKDIYIFHDIYNDKNLFQLFNNYVDLPMNIKNKNFRISRFYYGFQYSGSNIHNHTKAINYLLSGQKLWILFPNSTKNIEFLEKYNFQYDKNNQFIIKTFLENYYLFDNNIENLKIIIQDKGEAIYIPNYYFHGVINLLDVYGITYSWY